MLSIKQPNFIMKKNLTKVAAIALLAISANFGASAQNDLGSACGCPAVASRPVINLSSPTYTVQPPAANEGELIANFTFTCQNTYVLDNKVYVPDGKTLVIQPGTVIKGAPTGTTLAANALIVSRGGKLIADGTASCPIVFTTTFDPMDGTYGLNNKGKWGGVVLLGRAANNLKTASNYSATGTFPTSATGTQYAAGTALNATSAVVNGVTIPSGYFGGDGIGSIEGFTSAEQRNLYGMPVGYEINNDNSGVLRYVSIRHAGALVGDNNELNGLSLGSVGSGTTIENLEVVSSDDDGIEFFGGTVNIKYAAMMFGNDDMFDYDLGWSGKAQFLFGVQVPNATFTGGDNGFEADNDDQKSNATPNSHPIIYNSTFIGNGFTGAATGGPSGPAAIKAKEKTEGEIYSSIFANFKGGLDLIKSLGTANTFNNFGARAGTVESYHNWTGVDNTGAGIIGGPKLIVSCNTFVNCVNPISIANATTALTVPFDNNKFTADGNTSVATLGGFDFTFACTAGTATSGNNFGTTVSDKYDAVPTTNIVTTCVPPTDGFFTYTNYRGAFDANAASWLSNWSYAKLVSATTGLVACPTDITKDGITNTNDFLELIGSFGQSCN
jgi:hypothetical protein